MSIKFTADNGSSRNSIKLNYSEVTRSQPSWCYDQHNNFSFPKIPTNPGHYTPNEGIPDTGYPFKIYLNPCSHSIHSNAFSCALAAKPLSQPKCILLPWISWHKLVREWRMQSVPSHFSTCTNTRDLETLHKFLLTSYRQSLNGLKRANCLGDNTSPFTKETSSAPSNKISPPSAAIKALLLSQQSSRGKCFNSHQPRAKLHQDKNQLNRPEHFTRAQKSPDAGGALWADQQEPLQAGDGSLGDTLFWRGFYASDRSLKDIKIAFLSAV